jgi:hypothetical protein
MTRAISAAFLWCVVLSCVAVASCAALTPEGYARNRAALEGRPAEESADDSAAQPQSPEESPAPEKLTELDAQTTFSDDRLSIVVQRIHTEPLGTSLTLSLRNAAESHVSLQNLTFYFGPHVVASAPKLDLPPRSEIADFHVAISSQAGIDQTMEVFRLSNRQPPPNSLNVAYEKVRELNQTISPELPAQTLASQQLELGVAVRYRTGDAEHSFHKTELLSLSKLKPRGW